MYKIGLRSGAAVSAGHMMEVEGSIAYRDIEAGDVVCVVGGFASHTEAGQCPDAIVSSVNCKAVDEYGEYPTNITVMLLTPDMFLEVPVSGTDAQISGLKNGAFIGFGNSSVKASETSEFCQIIDTLSAKTAGDTILVRFIRKEIE